jgi:hypothetical protein
MKNMIWGTFGGMLGMFLFGILLAAQVGGVAPFNMKEELHHEANQQALSDYLQRHCQIYEASDFAWTDKDGKKGVTHVPPRLQCNNYEEDGSGNYRK